MFCITGLDLSFNSTGICCTLVDDKSLTIERMLFARVVYDQNYKSKKAPINVNTYVYSLPKFITATSLILTSEKDDENSYEQIEGTLRALRSSKVIYDIVHAFIMKHAPITSLIVSIENYIMPSFGGRNALSNVSGLITLQAYVREHIIRYSSHNNINLKMVTPSPSTVKKMFTGSGKSEKEDMMKHFLSDYDGAKLLPLASEKTVDVLNDVVDAFAMNMYAYSKIVHNPSIINIQEI